ncbi:MAG: recombination mediator RecR [Candidatus Sumerlaeia bacterium]|nr:recombination mediator RecR [Candidatus Sumerlaeia bacterium]
MKLTPAMETLIAELVKLPTIGRKSAQRLAFHLLRAKRDDALALARAIERMRETVRFCAQCGNIAEAERCGICSDPSRDPSLICVVEEVTDLVAFERPGSFRGLYHVLGGCLSPLHGVTPEKLAIAPLMERLRSGSVREVIIATNPSVDGEATALYLAKLARPLGVRVTRIGMGIPIGSSVEFADEITVQKALEGRREIEG